MLALKRMETVRLRALSSTERGLSSFILTVMRVSPLDGESVNR